MHNRLKMKNSIILTENKSEKSIQNEKKEKRDKKLANALFDINGMYTNEELSSYFKRLFSTHHNTVNEGKTQIRVISPQAIDKLLMMCGFHFHEATLTVFYAVLDPVRPRISSNRGTSLYKIDDCVKALIYCREREFFKWNGKIGKDGRTYPSYK